MDKANLKDGIEIPFVVKQKYPQEERTLLFIIFQSNDGKGCYLEEVLKNKTVKIASNSSFYKIAGILKNMGAVPKNFGEYVTDYFKYNDAPKSTHRDNW